MLHSALDVPVYAFDKTVNGQNLEFEIVSTTFDNGIVVEEQASWKKVKHVT